jgi:hypothetical protein
MPALRLLFSVPGLQVPFSAACLPIATPPIPALSSGTSCARGLAPPALNVRLSTFRPVSLPAHRPFPIRVALPLAPPLALWLRTRVLEAARLSMAARPQPPTVCSMHLGIPRLTTRRRMRSGISPNSMSGLASPVSKLPFGSALCTSAPSAPGLLGAVGSASARLDFSSVACELRLLLAVGSVLRSLRFGSCSRRGPTRLVRLGTSPSALSAQPSARFGFSSIACELRPVCLQ